MATLFSNYFYYLVFSFGASEGTKVPLDGERKGNPCQTL